MSVTQLMTLASYQRISWDGIVTYMIIAGGGGGGSYHGAGGGAGGVLYGTATYTAPFALTVGAGGGANVNGGNSEAFGLTTIGGGSGGAGQDSGGDGGSGGGRGGWTGSFRVGYGTAGPPRQGYDGGNFSGQIVSNGAGVGGGGGGAGGVGGNGGSTNAGHGGVGLTNAFLTTLEYGQESGGSYYVAGGGGGGGWQTANRSQGNGGLGGGGRGGYYTTANYQSGTNGLGGGGGGKQQNFVTLSATGITLPNPVAIAGTDDHYYAVQTVGSGTVTMST